ncbi:MAG: tetratricopeptide repeat protein [Deltaproteobacteria bacterium]
MVKLLKDNFDGAIADYDKTLNYDAKDAISWNNRGIAKREKGDRSGAVADFRKALEINPALSSARNSLHELGVEP